MPTKKTTTYNPNAEDRDGDGMIQEGTEFERPVGTVLPEECCMEDCGECSFSTPVEAVEAPVEAVEAPVEATKPAPKAKTSPKVYVARDGDSYATVADLYPVEGMTKHERSLQLWRDHGGRALKDGVEVKL